MPKLTLAVPETYDSVTRPVIYDVTRQLFKITGLHENTPILYPSAHGVTMQPGSTMKHNTKDSELAFDDQIRIEVEEEIDKDRILSTAVLYPENRFVFHDPRVETILKPVYSTTDITINFKFRANDEVKAKRWREQIRVRMSSMRDVHLIGARYSYQLPYSSVIILQEIHRLMENVSGYGDSFAQWFKNSASDHISATSNFSGSQMQLAVAEHQANIVGIWDFEGAPEGGSKEDQGNTWTISFSFKFKYDKPVSMVMQYPQMIHQQVIKYQDKTVPYNPDQVESNRPLSGEYLKFFDKTRALDGIVNGNMGLRFPIWDEFIPNVIPAAYIRIFSSMMALDLTTGGNPQLLGSLDDLPEGYGLDDDMKAFLITEAPYLTNQYYSVFSLNLYNANMMEPNGSLTVDSSLNVSTTFNPNPRARFHLWFGLCFNWYRLSADAQARLRANYTILIRLIKAIWPQMPKSQYPVAIPGTNQCSQSSWSNFLYGQSSGQYRRDCSTVETLIIQAHRKS
ncbi:hypothetical protein [Paraburkholderia sp. BCC1886]|uniref:hypothetical protein n=1 Tax=Paraburkholderia sp. BCC1886 TaxID=2562670 RepID=UPI001183BB3D|nr:hypothetical protein [Paraburkholderia sp. BCC1886]